MNFFPHSVRPSQPARVTSKYFYVPWFWVIFYFFLFLVLIHFRDEGELVEECSPKTLKTMEEKRFSRKELHDKILPEETAAPTVTTGLKFH